MSDENQEVAVESVQDTPVEAPVEVQEAPVEQPVVEVAPESVDVTAEEPAAVEVEEGDDFEPVTIGEFFSLEDRVADIEARLEKYNQGAPHKI